MFFCAAHGGGKRCKVRGCKKSAVGGCVKCTSHGGGKRCQNEGCTKSAQSGTRFCVRHGGGKKCVVADCSKVARGKTGMCMLHNSVKRRILCGEVQNDSVALVNQIRAIMKNGSVPLNPEQLAEEEDNLVAQDEEKKMAANTQTKQRDA